MKVSSIREIENTERHVRGDGFESIRIVLEKDGMGFSVHKTLIPAGTKRVWHYKYHLETCYCIKGKAIVTNLANGDKHTISADTAYSLDDHDRHQFEALTDVVLISVFNQPVKGQETHKEDGSYEI